VVVTWSALTEQRHAVAAAKSAQHCNFVSLRTRFAKAAPFSAGEVAVYRAVKNGYQSNWSKMKAVGTTSYRPLLLCDLLLNYRRLRARRSCWDAKPSFMSSASKPLPDEAGSRFTLGRGERLTCPIWRYTVLSIENSFPKND